MTVVIAYRVTAEIKMTWTVPTVSFSRCLTLSPVAYSNMNTNAACDNWPSLLYIHSNNVYFHLLGDASILFGAFKVHVGNS